MSTLWPLAVVEKLKKGEGLNLSERETMTNPSAARRTTLCAFRYRLTDEIHEPVQQSQNEEEPLNAGHIRGVLSVATEEFKPQGLL